MDAKRILVIDDDEIVRSMLIDSLTHEGYSVLQADNGLSGLGILEVKTVDLIITDICMPGLEGVRTIQRIKQKCPEVKIIAMSGADKREQYLATAKEFGADLMLPKPCERSVLLNYIKEFFN